MKKTLRALMAAALVVAVAPAAGQVLLLDINTSVPLAATLDNPCTPELEAIALSGATQLVQKVWLLPDGNMRLQFAENTSLQGVDGAALLGGAQYAVNGASQKDVEFEPLGFSVVQFKKVVRDGGTDNFHSLLVLAFDPQNLQLQLGLEAACENGMP